MRCPSRHRLAAASAGEDTAAALHAETCAHCRAELTAMAAVVRLAREAPAPPLTASRRTAIRTEVLAACDIAGPGTRRSHRGAAAAIAAMVVGLAWYGRSTSHGPGIAARPRPAEVTAPTAPNTGRAARPAGGDASALVDPRVDPRSPHGAHSGAPAAAPPLTNTPVPAPVHPATVSPSAPLAIATVADGRATVDARNTAPVRVVSGDTAIRVASSKVELTSRGGAVTKVHVIVGSAEIDLRGKRTIVFAGDVWVRPAPSPRALAATAMTAFERGWVAFRAARYNEAIAAFDQAQDPVIAEDAAYWAAIASARAGDRSSAARRLRDFTARFPAAMRADDARRTLARLDP